MNADKLFIEKHPDSNIFAFWIAKPKIHNFPDLAQTEEWQREENAREATAFQNGGRYYAKTALEIIYQEWGAQRDAAAMKYAASVSGQKAWPKVTVVIVNWNGEGFIERCLTALLAQTAKPHEIILLDNASTDGSVEIARRFPAVRVIALEQNTGFARGNNLAIEAASKESEWIALINPDAFAAPRWLETLLAAADSRPEFDVFGSMLVNAADSTLLDGTGDAYHISGLAWRTAHGVAVSHLGKSECEIFSPCAAAALYRRSALLRVGGFDEDFFCYVEDVDLGFRLRLSGYRCLFVPKSVVHHVGSGTTGGKNSDFSLYHGYRNMVWTFVKGMPGLLFWLLLPLHVMLNLVGIVWFAFRGQGRVVWRAKRDALLGLPKMWRKRRQIQKSRIASVSDIWRVLDKHLIPKIRKS